MWKCLKNKNYFFIKIQKKNRLTAFINNHLGILDIASVKLGDKSCKIF
jgi:hypothetical protein